ncbi:MAG: nuclear transport factor 2 family protein [Pseudomonadota bacterium]
MNDHVRCVEEIFSLLSSFEFQKISALLHPNAVMELPYAPEGVPASLDSPGAMIEMFETIPSLFKRFELRLTQLYRPSDASALLAEGKSTGLRQDDRPYQNQYVFLFRFLDGRVSHWREYFDPRQL